MYSDSRIRRLPCKRTACKESARRVWVTETRQPPLHCLKFTASSQTVSNSPCRNVRFASGMQSCMSILPMTVLLFVSVRCGFDYSTTSWAVRVSRPSPLRSDFVQFDSTCGFPGEGPQTSEVSTPQGNTSHAWIPDSWYACECEQRLVSPPPGPASAAGEFCPSSWGKWVPSPRKSAGGNSRNSRYKIPEALVRELLEAIAPPNRCRSQDKDCHTWPPCSPSTPHTFGTCTSGLSLPEHPVPSEGLASRRPPAPSRLPVLQTLPRVVACEEVAVCQ
jgi:hypothetical protein